MNINMMSISGPVNQDIVKKRIRQFQTWLETESGIYLTKDAPLEIKFWMEKGNGKETETSEGSSSEAVTEEVLSSSGKPKE